jgi:hypothetical protein
MSGRINDNKPPGVPVVPQDQTLENMKKVSPGVGAPKGIPPGREDDNGGGTRALDSLFGSHYSQGHLRNIPSHDPTNGHPYYYGLAGGLLLLVAGVAVAAYRSKKKNKNVKYYEAVLTGVTNDDGIEEDN